MSKLNRIAQRIVADKVVDDKIWKSKSKSTIRNHIYKLVDPFTRGVFRDDNWSNLKRVFQVLSEAGLDVHWWVEDGGYARDGMSKRYYFSIECENMYGKKFEFKGQLTACFCGSVKDPTDRYDMSFVIY